MNDPNDLNALFLAQAAEFNQTLRREIPVTPPGASANPATIMADGHEDPFLDVLNEGAPKAISVYDDQGVRGETARKIRDLLNETRRLNNRLEL